MCKGVFREIIFEKYNLRLIVLVKKIRIMKLELRKFGMLLTSHPLGREAYLAIQPVLRETNGDEVIEIDFDGVVALAPSWADEFLTPLQEQFKGRVVMKENNNSSVKATLELLESVKE